MTDHIKEIDKIIQKAALDGVLTSGAVKQFNELILERDALAKTVDAQKITLKSKEDECNHLQESLAKYREMEQTLCTREAAVEEDENEHRDRKVRLECADLRIKDHKEMFTTVFRNSVLRKEVMTPTHPSAPDQYGTRQEGYPSKDTTEEEET